MKQRLFSIVIIFCMMFFFQALYSVNMTDLCSGLQTESEELVVKDQNAETLPEIDLSELDLTGMNSWGRSHKKIFGYALPDMSSSEVDNAYDDTLILKWCCFYIQAKKSKCSSVRRF